MHGYIMFRSTHLRTGSRVFVLVTLVIATYLLSPTLSLSAPSISPSRHIHSLSISTHLPSISTRTWSVLRHLWCRCSRPRPTRHARRAATSQSGPLSTPDLYPREVRPPWKTWGLDRVRVCRRLSLPIGWDGTVPSS